VNSAETAPRRIVYMGTPAMAVGPLTALHAAGFDIVLVVTGPDRRRGRGKTTSPTPVKAEAERLGLRVSHDPDDVLAANADLGVVVAFGQLIKGHLLDALPFVNMHFSLLPRWRGAAPVERAILAGDTQTGVCIMGLEIGLDTGPIFTQTMLRISETVTAAELAENLVDVGSKLLVETLRNGLPLPTPQVGEATYAKKFTSSEFFIDWTQSADEVNRWIRVGGAHTLFRGNRLKIWQAKVVHGVSGRAGEWSDGHVVCGEGVLQLTEVQAEGKPRMDVASWVNGAQPTPLEMFGDVDG